MLNLFHPSNGTATSNESCEELVTLWLQNVLFGSCSNVSINVPNGQLMGIMASRTWPIAYKPTAHGTRGKVHF